MDTGVKVSGFNDTAGWSWPEDLRQRTAPSDDQAGGSPSSAREPKDEPSQDDNAPPSDEPEPEPEPEPKHYKLRTCRICLETVLPTYEPPSVNLPTYLQGAPKVTYVSEDGGRLIRPCRCKGSQRYVHEGCLQEWRHADPSYGARNFWQCPTCGFKYRLERMKWGRWISSKMAQMVLTLVIFIGAVFLLGFVADPIISTFADPVGSIVGGLFGEEDDGWYNARPTDRRWQRELEEERGWFEHFLKGFMSLGVLGFTKMLWGLSPFNWLNLRGGGLFGGGRVRVGNAGRDRATSISWVVLIIGICTFLYVSTQSVYSLSTRRHNLLTGTRRCGKLFVRYLGASWRKLANVLWTYPLLLERPIMGMIDHEFERLLLELHDVAV